MVEEDIKNSLKVTKPQQFVVLVDPIKTTHFYFISVLKLIKYKLGLKLEKKCRGLQWVCCMQWILQLG